MFRNHNPDEDEIDLIKKKEEIQIVEERRDLIIIFVLFAIIHIYI